MSTDLFRWMLLATLLNPWMAQAEQRMELDGTAVVGSRESPQVLYLVPWRKSGPGDPLGMPPLENGDDLLVPLERAVFRRQLDYFSAANE
ncbi:MAG: hypothetical protein OI74_08365 [Gammaproteobacteria bacterium (ex Lamellibrachia satsuma)]|nr:MAG: hypothetical protein HPY30_14275 [Gammaproteobacteria bacterium (ex Lamellibrachia satsuma)]RRS33312.1 MAG: hypothetical protein OI74_08365 [Gammaproteobacteria bacterium (ex Lamellibrachia satsuma)]RRS35027.1 MAG: hypothetical protein NV67_11755 [Gammaproteobacteria bacterium (ex Lamellibrachia satsuma)]